MKVKNVSDHAREFQPHPDGGWVRVDPGETVDVDADFAEGLRGQDDLWKVGNAAGDGTDAAAAEEAG